MYFKIKATLCVSLLTTWVFCVAAQSVNTNEWVFIQGGHFLMGSPETEEWREKDETLHTVTVESFYLGKQEVTQAEYRRVTGKNPSSFKGDNLPVEMVSWYDAIRYCNARSELEKLEPVYIIKGTSVHWNRNAGGYRLPTETEWEYACRAGTTTPFNTESSIRTEEANYYGYYPYGIEQNYFTQERLETKPGSYRQKTIPVSSFPPNRWGLYDMHGNVSEWCYDNYGKYDKKDPSNPQETLSNSMKVSRGGGWNDFAKHLRSAFRSAAPPDTTSSAKGFRLARNAK